MIDSNTQQAINVLIKSDEKGLAKYGRLLSENKEDDFIDHAISESGDMLKYLVRYKNHIKQLCKENPNDADLGEIIRFIYG